MNQDDDIISHEEGNLRSRSEETEWNWMTIVAIIMAGFLAVYLVRPYIWQFNARLNGMDAEAHVSWIEHVVRHGYGDGAEYPMAYYYVRFQKDDGSETEARLLNPNKKLTVGSIVRIRYLPWHEDIATLMEIKD